MPNSKAKASSKMFNYKKLQDWLVRHRQENKVGLRVISSRSGISISRLSEIEHGRIKNPSLRYFTGLARAVGYERLSDFIAELEKGC